MDDTKYLLELIDILAKGQGMADCADSPLMKLREKIVSQGTAPLNQSHTIHNEACGCWQYPEPVTVKLPMAVEGTGEGAGEKSDTTDHYCDVCGTEWGTKGGEDCPTCRRKIAAATCKCGHPKYAHPTKNRVGDGYCIDCRCNEFVACEASASREPGPSVVALGHDVQLHDLAEEFLQAVKKHVVDEPIANAIAITAYELMCRAYNLAANIPDEITMDEAVGIAAGLQDAAAGRTKPIEQIRAEVSAESIAKEAPGRLADGQKP